MSSPAITRACDLVGGQVVLAQRLGVTPQAVNQWVKKGKPPPERVLAIEEATDRQVSRHELRPDLYGPAPEAVAA